MVYFFFFQILKIFVSPAEEECGYSLYSCYFFKKLLSIDHKFKIGPNWIDPILIGPGFVCTPKWPQAGFTEDLIQPNSYMLLIDSIC